ncbi:MAG TPA: DUF6036 family nucleotidyltransferase [Candidatus Dormibacteraeota bacterium]|nr:DUF6036 family nucleotidyltransferase [Candidatus Dormibacteraeota bacterium]
MRELLAALGALLQARGQRYTVVVVGGSSLLLQGLSTRTTQDVDVVALVERGLFRKADPLPAGLEEAARDVGVTAGVGGDWLNSMAAIVMNEPGLPQGFADRATALDFGALTVLVASRFDLICMKLHAAVDRASPSKHLDDLRLLKPSSGELVEAGVWARGHDRRLGSDFSWLPI